MSFDTPAKRIPCGPRCYEVPGPAFRVATHGVTMLADDEVAWTVTESARAHSYFLS